MATPPHQAVRDPSLWPRAWRDFYLSPHCAFISWSLESWRSQPSFAPGSVPPALCDTGRQPASPLQPEIPGGKFQLLHWERERLLCGWEGLALPGNIPRLPRVCRKLSLQQWGTHKLLLVVPGSCCVQLEIPVCSCGSETLKCSASSAHLTVFSGSEFVLI